jgi:hypothetical protein
MSPKENGDLAAYPSERWAVGLTKRELFAAMMMEAMVANGEIPVSKQSVAECAVNYADALLAELERNPS